MDKRSSYTIEDGEHAGEVIISWIITHSCQERCGYCISPCKQEELTSEEEHFAIQRKLIDGGLTKIRYIGGEPLLIPHIEDLIQSAYMQGLNTRLSTNGILLEEKRFQKIRNYLNSVAFAFESGSDEVNAHIRGRYGILHREIVVDRIKMVKDTDNIGVLINTCVHKENIQYLEELGNILSELHVDHWKLRRFNSASGRGAVPNKERFEITDDEFFDIVKSLQQKYPSLRIDGRMPEKLNTRLMISPQGDLYRMVDSNTIFYGNMLQDNLKINEIYWRDHCN